MEQEIIMVPEEKQPIQLEVAGGVELHILQQ